MTRGATRLAKQHEDDHHHEELDQGEAGLPDAAAR